MLDFNEARAEAAPGSNRHPVDQLAEVRAEIAALKEREGELRDLILKGDCTLSGNEFVADVSVTERASLDGPAVRKALGDDRLAQWLKTSETKTVRVKARIREEGDE